MDSEENKNETQEQIKQEEENKDSEIQFSQIIQKDENTDKKMDSIQSDLFATKVFMKSIDLRCEDHLTKFQEDVEATRFCQKCNILVCDSCVIDYHIEHINSAKKKVDEFFIAQKNNIIELNNKIQDSIKYKINEKEIDKIINSQKKLVEDFFKRKAEQTEIFLKKIKNLQNQELEIKNAIIKSIEIFYKDECYKRLQKPIENNEILGKKIERFIKDWSQYNKREKVVVLKNNVIEDFQKETENNLNIIKEEMKNFKGKSIDIEKKINGLIDALSKGDKINEFNKIYNDMNDSYLNILKDIGELKYDKLIVQKLEDIKNKKVEIDNNYQDLLKDKMFNNNIDDNNNNNLRNNNLSQSQIPRNNQYPPQNQNQYPPQQPNQYPQQPPQYPPQNQNPYPPQQPNQYPQQPPQYPPQQSNQYPPSQPNKYPPQQKNNMPQYGNNQNNNYDNNLDDGKDGDFNLLSNMDSGNIMNNNSNLKSSNNNMNNNNYNEDLNNPYAMNNNQNKNNNIYQQNQQLKQSVETQFNYELIIYLKEDRIFAYNEKHGLFSLKLNVENLERVPDKSRFVNLGQSALLTGGMTQDNKISNKCYLIGLIENDSSNNANYSISVTPYGDFKEARERHNLIYLPNKNFVFACGGFYSKSCEYTDVYRGNWELLKPMNKSRGNASMAYVNDRFIYIMGGFELGKDLPKGNYLNDIEMFDVNNFGNGWKIIYFNNPNRYNMSLTALGVVPISKSLFLICGGYDGREYKNNCYKVDCNNYNSPLVEETDGLQNATIFTHNMFCKIRKSYFNFDFQGQMYGFDYENWRFGMLNMNQMNQVGN